MRMLAACEKSGVVRDAFARAGWEAWSCDTLLSERPGKHYQCDVRLILCEGWDLLICFPPCTYLCSSGMHWTTRGLRDPKLTDEAVEFVQTLLGAPIPHISLENPVGILSTRIRKPDQIIQPWMFGHDASKATCLWLKNLPKLEPTCVIEPRIVNGRKLWANQTPSGQNKLGPSPERSANRARTYEGIAEAMATQWSRYVSNSLKSAGSAPIAENPSVRSATSTTTSADVSDPQRQMTLGIS